MKKLLFMGASVFILSTAATANSLSNTHFTHTFEPEPVTSFKVAAAYFLPDYSGTDYKFKADDNLCTRSGYTATTCPDANMYAPADKACPTDNRLINPADCVCKPEFNLTSCSNNKVLGDAKCNGKAKECVCPAKYQYTAANCTDNRSLSGGSCDGKYETCACGASYKFDTAACKAAYGTNATVSGSACGGKYNACSCSPSPAAGWSTTAPTCTNNGQGYESKDNGCKGTYYKCKPCVKNGMPAGYQESSSCTYGVAATQADGCGGTYYQCGTCANECSLATCPAKLACRKEDCSGKYCITGCAIGYIDEDKYWQGL